jgi:nitrous oxidase accessory protein
MAMVFFMGTSLWGKTIEVCADCEVKSIKEGIALATDFDTLLIKKGNYKEFNIVVDKP